MNRGTRAQPSILVSIPWLFTCHALCVQYSATVCAAERCYHSNYGRCVMLCYVMLCMLISHAACALACSVDSSFACWPFLARHSPGSEPTLTSSYKHTHSASCSSISTTQPPSWTTALHPCVGTNAPINTPA
jgi:hypothetical protein